MFPNFCLLINSFIFADDRYLLPHLLTVGVTVSKVIPQGHFLLAMGADKRLEALITPDSVSDDDAERLVNGLEYLVSDKYMGKRFKVIAFSSADSDIVGFPPQK